MQVYPYTLTEAYEYLNLVNKRGKKLDVRPSQAQIHNSTCIYHDITRISWNAVSCLSEHCHKTELNPKT